jgi:hypothetical protein
MIGAALPIIKRLPWRYIGAAIAAAGIAWVAYSWAWQRGHDSRDREVAVLVQERDTARANVATLERAVARQNAAIALAAAKGANAQQGATWAAKQGQKRAPAVAATVARLGAVEASGACPVAGEVKAAWERVR